MDRCYFKVCTDCLFVLEYDEDAAEWTEAQAEAHRAEMTRRLAGLNVTLGDTENDEEFSREQCGACGSTLGGHRHPVTGWYVNN